MSILIKGMEMPTNADMAPTAVWVYPNGYAVVFKDNGKMQQYTQAVPVPPHGDLIDRDELPWIEGRDEQDNPAYLLLKKSVDVLPTIIPAEEGE